MADRLTVSQQRAAEADLADVRAWPLDQLVNHVVSTHHQSVRRALPVIARHLTLLRKAHGSRHPELACLATVFDQISGDLERHLMKEEQILFPYIRELVRLERDGIHPGQSPFGTIVNPIAMMEREHLEAAEGLKVMRELTRDYSVPADGCSTYAECMAELADFERDLYRHVRLENNVLYPRAVALERHDDDD
jgi:regulator of cell morphogenesis and NO signaling